MTPLEVGIILFVTFGILLASGLPISVSIGMSSLVAAYLSIGKANTVAQFSAQRMFSGIDSFALLAIPFFVLAGNIMNQGGIALRLINLAKAMAGRLPGALIHANIIANMFFGAISGSSVAAAAAVGGTMGPIQEKEGYPKEFCAAANIASAPAGFLIPPSGPMIVFSLVSGGTSIAALFIAGYIPGILMGLSLMVYVYFVSKKRGYPVYPSITWMEFGSVLWKAFFSLMLVIIVIVCGLFTATEGAAVAVVYAAVLSVIYRSLTWKQFWDATVKAAHTTAVVLFLIGSSSIMSWIMSYTGIPNAISDSILRLSDNWFVVMLLINICLAIIGTFMDVTPAILIFTPIFMPIALKLGMDPVHFGVMFIFNMCLGNMTPPVGSVLFVGCSIAKLRIEQVVRPLLPFFGVLLFDLLFVTYIPQLSLFLPKLFGVM